MLQILDLLQKTAVVRTTPSVTSQASLVNLLVNLYPDLENTAQTNT